MKTLKYFQMLKFIQRLMFFLTFLLALGGMLAENIFAANPEEYGIFAEFDGSIQPESLLTARVEITNHTEAGHGFSAILALYDDINNRLMDLNYRYLEIQSKSTGYLTTAITLPAKLNGCKAKIFVWDGENLNLASAIPLTAPVVKKVQAAYYVDPANGNDSNSGVSKTAALRTIEKAREKVDAINDNMTGDIYVYLRGGTYVLGSTLMLDASDSGTNGFKVFYKAYGSEIPVISGGQDLSGGWALHDAVKNIYKKNVGSLEFRELYVNNNRAVRARTPNKANHDTLGPYKTILRADCANKTVRIPKDDIEDWQGLNRIEMVMTPHWYEYRGRISAFTKDADYATVSFQTPEANSIFLKGDSFWVSPGVASYYMENAYDFVDAEGEWFLDVDADTLYYKPLAGEDISAVSIVAPKLEKLMDISGTSTSPVKSVQFEGLTFKYAGWKAPSANGAAFTQGARSIMSNPKIGAITVNYAQRISFMSCDFEFLALSGMSLVKGVKDHILYNCNFRYLAGNGVVVHDDGTVNPPMEDACERISILNNYFTRIGQSYSNAMPIVCYFVNSVVVQNNEICYTPYMGMQIGGQTPNPDATRDVGMKDNVIRHNYIHHAMQFHDDGGGIYTLSRQPGTYIFENYIDNIYRSGLTGSWPVAGVYLDNCSEFVTAEHNCITGTTQSTYEQTGIGARNNYWVNNINTTDSSITNYAGRKNGKYFWPIRVDAENMNAVNYTVEGGTVYSNNWGVKATAGTTGTLTTNFSGPDGIYSIDTAYIAEDDGNAVYRLYVDGVEADSWTAAPVPAGTGTHIRHHTKHDVAVKNGQQIRLDGVQTSGSHARVDYISIYQR